MIAWLRALSALLLASLAAASQRCDPAQISPPMPSGVSLDQCVLLHAGDASTPALRLLWRVSGSSVSFGVNIAAPLSDLGYVALGSSYNGGMKGAELWVARLDGDGRFQLEAFWSRDYVKPGHSSRASKSLTLLGWQSTAQGASWAFTRPVAAWGSEMDSIPLLRAGGDNMIWAIGSSPGDFNYHGSLRGGVRISLPEGPAGDDVQSSDERTLFVRTPATYTSGSPSRYCWSWHQLPSDKKYHITKVKATVANDHPGLIHHIVSYACPDSFALGGGGSAGDTLRRGGVICRDEGSMPPACPQNFIGWASSDVLRYPPEAGFPFGAGETKSILLEVHYENLAQTKGIVDRSGFEFTFTERLRPHDLGYLIVGDSLEQQAAPVKSRPQRLPAGHAEYEVSNFCPASCIRQMLPSAKSELHVVSTTFHMHVKGVHEYLEVWRDGKRMGGISQPYWDFEHQRALPAERGTVLHADDALLTRCVFNTRNSTQLESPYITGSAAPGGEQDVVGGFGTYNKAEGHFEEMCYAFVLVWPKPLRSTCIALKNVGFPSMIYCERDAQNRLLPWNLMFDTRADAHTYKGGE